MKNYKAFKIRPLEYNDYKFIIFSESYETPFSHLDKISRELKKSKTANCKVIFDMLFNMGNTSERFAEAIFDGSQFINSTFKYVKIDKKNQLRKCSVEFFKKKPEILDCSILNSIQKKMINKGIAI